MFTAAYKLRIVREADEALASGREHLVGALLRRRSLRRGPPLTSNSTSSSPGPSRRMTAYRVLDFARVRQWRSMPRIASGTKMLAWR